jgi:hypothetical protein
MVAFDASAMLTNDDVRELELDEPVVFETDGQA